MTKRDNRLIIGGIFVLIGILALAQNLDVLGVDSQTIVGLTFLLGGAAIFYRGRQEQNKWKFYGGVAAMFIGFAIFMDSMRFLPDDFIATAFLWIVAALFLRVHLSKREAYWPIIPAGIFLTIGLAVLLDGYRIIHGETVGALIVFGIAATFGYLYAIRNEQNKLDWAKYPAGGMCLISLFIYFSERHVGMGPLIFAVALILAGIGLIIQTVRADRQVDPKNQTA